MRFAVLVLAVLGSVWRLLGLRETSLPIQFHTPRSPLSVALRYNTIQLRVHGGEDRKPSYLSI